MTDWTPRRYTHTGLPGAGSRSPVAAVNVTNTGATPASGLTARTRSAARQHDALNLQTATDNAQIDGIVLHKLGPFEGENRAGASVWTPKSYQCLVLRHDNPHLNSNSPKLNQRNPKSNQNRNQLQLKTETVM